MKKDHVVTWEEAVRRCRLDPDAERMARELGLQPKALVRVIPGPNEPWKATVSDWVRHLYDRKARRAARPSGGQETPHEQRETFMPPGDDGRFVIADDAEDEDGEWCDGMPRGRADEGDEPSWVEDLRILARREQFRLAAQLVAFEFSQISFVERVALIGSVAALPVRERPRRRARHSTDLTWHEPKDVDLAVWTSALDNLNALRSARSGAVARLFEQTGLGVAHHQVEVFILDATSDHYRGVLCVFGQCPKGKRECLVPHCGEAAFLRQFDGFRFRPSAIEPRRMLVLFDRRAARRGGSEGGSTTPPRSEDDAVPF
jgi:hypothetical protein